jgi:threonine/homoserine/homoserine lactone efflux protein
MVAAMPDLVAFCLPVLMLLATPGPTNTLLAASGAAHGLRASAGLVPAEIAGYLTAITILVTVVGPALAAQPLLATGLKLAACVWLLGCAARLWCRAAGEIGLDGARVTPLRLFLTTLVNPKGLVFALVLMPPLPLTELGPWLAVLAAEIVVAALGWISLGAILARRAGSLATPARIWRLAAVALSLFAVLLAGSALASY